MELACREEGAGVEGAAAGGGALPLRRARVGGLISRAGAVALQRPSGLMRAAGSYSQHAQHQVLKRR